MINGLTNGNGNKDGLINGNSKKPEKPKKSVMSSSKGRLGAWAVVGIVLLLIFGVFAISTNSFKTTDWNVIHKYRDYDLSSVANPNIDINKFAFHQARGAFEFYINFAGNFLDSGKYKNLAYVLIDNDTNRATGYDTGYIGADYMIKIEGYNGTLRGSLMKFTSMNQHIWNWTVEETAIMHHDGNTITGSINHLMSGNAKIMIVAQSGYEQDITPVVGIEKPALLVVQTPLKNDTLEVELKPMYGAVNVDSLTISYPAGVQIPGLEGTKYTIGTTLTLSKNYYFKVDTSNVYQSGVEVKVSSVASDSIYTIWGNSFRKYVGTPSTIQIDGYFDDWNRIVGVNNFNYNPTGNVANPNIDLYQYSHYNSSKDVFFYASVKGTMLAGNIAPEIEKAPSGNWSNATPLPQQGKSPYDYAEITFTTQSHGTHTVQVFGFNGQVIRVLYDGQPTDQVKVGVGKNGEYGALELSVPGNYKVTSYHVKMTDWNKESDEGSAHGVLIPTRHSAITIDGDPSDWTGTAPTSDNSFTISNGEFIWKDASGDNLTDNTYDLLQFRMTSDGSYLYFLFEFNNLSGLGQDGAPGIMVTLDTDQVQNNGNPYFGYNSETQVAQNGNANWEYQLLIDLAANNVSDGQPVYGDGNQVWNGGSSLDLVNTSWDDNSTSSDEYVASTTYNAVEARISLSEIGNPSTITVELGIVRMSSKTPGDAWDLSGSDVIDAMTTAQDTSAEVNDGYIDYYVTITFDTSTGDVNTATDSTGTTVPELSPTLAVPLLFIVAVPIILRRRKE